MCGSILKRRRIVSIIPSRWSAGKTRSPIAPGCRARPAASSGCRPKPNGRRRRAAGSRENVTRGATASIARRRTSSTTRRQTERAGTTAAAAFRRTAYGLFDMAGNVWEWVHDWHSASYYATSPLHAPTGPREGTLRVVRGGSWLASDTSHALVQPSAQSAARHVFVRDWIQSRVFGVTVRVRVQC